MARKDGFVRLPNWLLDDSSLNPQELIVYLILLRHRNPTTGTCFPGMSTIADLGRMSLKSAERAVRGLEEVHGVITVTRRKSITENKPNVYRVALPSKELPEGMQSARGTRIPKRPPRAKSNGAPIEKGVRFTPTDSESVAADSAASEPQTPSPMKKINEKKTKEEDVTHVFDEAVSEAFSFDLPDKPRATEKQVAYLKDLAIHIGYQTGGGIPNEAQLQRWRKLTRGEADKLIYGYKKALGRPDDLYYPQEGDPEYEALTTAGQEFAQSAGDPGSVWDYGWAGKENSK